MNAPQSLDLYKMACVFTMISALDEDASVEDRECLQVRAVGYLGRAIKCKTGLLRGDDTRRPRCSIRSAAALTFAS